MPEGAILQAKPIEPQNFLKEVLRHWRAFAKVYSAARKSQR
jgi:hypothetical protein